MSTKRRDRIATYVVAGLATLAWAVPMAIFFGAVVTAYRWALGLAFLSLGAALVFAVLPEIGVLTVRLSTNEWIIHSRSTPE
jgi:hypothetical protein